MRPLLCLVADAGRDPASRLAALRAAWENGVDWIQLRDRRLEGSALLEFADAVRDMMGGPTGSVPNESASQPPRLWINRRADVALACGAAGVHVGFDGPPLTALQRLGLSAGVSAHRAAEIREAARAGAVYALLAPIYPPLSKPLERPPLGAAALGAARSAGIPVLAQGGIEADRIGEVLRAGASGVAVTGAILGAPDPGAAARTLRRALDRAASAPLEAEAIP